MAEASTDDTVLVDGISDFQLIRRRQMDLFPSAGDDEMRAAPRVASNPARASLELP
jgi:hypothetical protein